MEFLILCYNGRYLLELELTLELSSFVLKSSSFAEVSCDIVDQSERYLRGRWGHGESQVHAESFFFRGVDEILALKATTFSVVLDDLFTFQMALPALPVAIYSTTRW